MTDALRDLNVIVTGAASGIGRATAELLHSRQARVTVADFDRAGVEATVVALSQRDAPRPLGCVCDVRKAEDCQRLVDDAERAFGPLGALVHCAGILRPHGSRPRPAHELDLAEFEAVIGTNLRGTFLINQAALRKMLPRKSGQIVNLSSTSGLKGRPLDSLYSASKAGVIGLSDSIAEEVRPFGIRVQVILPDAVDTPLWQQNGPFPHAPPGALSPQRIAEVIAMCLALPADTYCDRLVVRPVAPSRRRSRSVEPATPRSTDVS